jgi:phage shock protein A
MGILQRISTLLKSNVNSAIDRVSDPGKQIDQLVLEMEEQQKKARGEVQQAMALEKRYKNKIPQLERQAADWEEKAATALKLGDEGLAREALVRKGRIDEEAEEMRRAAEEQARYVAELTQALKALDQRVKEVKLRKETLKAEARARKGREKGGVGSSAFERFEGLSSDIDTREAEVELDQELEGQSSSRKDLDARFAALEKDQALEDKLAALKEKMAKKE